MELFLRYLSPLRLFIVQPAFSEYEAIGRRLGIPVVHAPLQRSSDGFSLPLQFIDDNIRNGDVVLLNNPHNPTGVAWPTSVWLERVLTWCRRGIPVVVDESFIDFLDEEATYTALPYLHDTSNLYIVRSATKMYAIPGLRFGFGFANPQAVPAIERDRDGWSVNQIAQAAAAAAYTDSTFAALTRTWLQQERAWIAETWGRHPDITCYLPTVNFFLVRLPTSLFAQSLQAKLSTDGMFVRSCQDFEGLGGEYLRVAIRAHEDNQALWTLVSESLDGL
jgi:threonine-phosphate decarboxylase